MVRTNEETTDGIEVVETKSRLTNVKNKDKPKVTSLVVDKPSLGIGFIIGSVLLGMFIVGCVVGSTMM